MNILLRKDKTCLDSRTNLSYRFEDWFHEECGINHEKTMKFLKIF